MFEILIISPFAHALEKQKDFVKLKLFCDEITDYKIHTIQALPDEIDEKIHGRQFDYAYIDVNYISNKVKKIREHVNGMQSKQIERF